MTSRTPPRLATALLTRLGPNDGALTGDLLEAYGAGRSALWYWWQVLASLFIGAGRDLRVNKWLGVHAVATFFGVQVFLAYVWKMLWFKTTLSMQVQELTVAVWGPQDPLVNAPYRWIFTLALFPLSLLAGWIVAKVHPRERGAAVMSCCVVGIAVGIPRLASLTHDPIAMHLYLHVGSMAVMVTGVPLGALMAGSQQPSATSQSIE